MDSCSHSTPIPIPTSGSVTVITASAGETSSPSRKAFWFSRKPKGPSTTSAHRLQLVSPAATPPEKTPTVTLATAAVPP